MLRTIRGTSLKRAHWFAQCRVGQANTGQVTSSSRRSIYSWRNSPSSCLHESQHRGYIPSDFETISLPCSRAAVQPVRHVSTERESPSSPSPTSSTAVLEELEKEWEKHWQRLVEMRDEPILMDPTEGGLASPPVVAKRLQPYVLAFQLVRTALYRVCEEAKISAYLLTPENALPKTEVVITADETQEELKEEVEAKRTFLMSFMDMVDSIGEEVSSTMKKLNPLLAKDQKTKATMLHAAHQVQLWSERAAQVLGEVEVFASPALEHSRSVAVESNQDKGNESAEEPDRLGNLYIEELESVPPHFALVVDVVGEGLRALCVASEAQSVLVRADEGLRSVFLDVTALREAEQQVSETPSDDTINISSRPQEAETKSRFSRIAALGPTETALHAVSLLTELVHGVRPAPTSPLSDIDTTNLTLSLDSPTPVNPYILQSSPSASSQASATTLSVFGPSQVDWLQWAPIRPLHPFPDCLESESDKRVGLISHEHLLIITRLATCQMSLSESASNEFHSAFPPSVVSAHALSAMEGALSAYLSFVNLLRLRGVDIHPNRAWEVNYPQIQSLLTKHQGGVMSSSAQRESRQPLPLLFDGFWQNYNRVDAKDPSLHSEHGPLHLPTPAYTLPRHPTQVISRKKRQWNRNIRAEQERIDRLREDEANVLSWYFGTALKTPSGGMTIASPSKDVDTTNEVATTRRDLLTAYLELCSRSPRSADCLRGIFLWRRASGLYSAAMEEQVRRQFEQSMKEQEKAIEDDLKRQDWEQRGLLPKDRDNDETQHISDEQAALNELLEDYDDEGGKTKGKSEKKGKGLRKTNSVGENMGVEEGLMDDAEVIDLLESGKYEGESYDEVVVHNALLPDGTRGDKVIKLGAPATKENMDAFRSSARLVSDNGSVLGLEAMKDLLSQDTMEVTAQLRKQVEMKEKQERESRRQFAESAVPLIRITDPMLRSSARLLLRMAAESDHLGRPYVNLGLQTNNESPSVTNEMRYLIDYWTFFPQRVAQPGRDTTVHLVAQAVQGMYSEQKVGAAKSFLMHMVVTGTISYRDGKVLSKELFKREHNLP